jgi:hypothetical protein
LCSEDPTGSKWVYTPDRREAKRLIPVKNKVKNMIYRTLTNDWVFEDFPSFILAEEATA